LSEDIDPTWLDTAFRAARPRAVAALLRYFRDLELAEEAFQDACLSALERWPVNGPPRDPAAWLILVGRNSGVDAARRRSRETALPPDEQLPDAPLADHSRLAERVDESQYRDDILRLLFICCHPELPATQQLALALRLVGGLSVKQIARAFLVGEDAMEQRITRAKKRVAEANVAYETPGAGERAERLMAVAAAIYLMFNEGYSATGATVPLRRELCEQAIRLGRLLLRLFADNPAIMGLLALMLLQHARSPARLAASGDLVLLEDQNRALWNRERIAEGLALLDKAMRHRLPDPYQVQAAIAALHADAPQVDETDWVQIVGWYDELLRLTDNPVALLNRAVAVGEADGAPAGLAALAGTDPGLPRYAAVAAYLHEKAGDLDEALRLYAEAARAALGAGERDHLTRQVARLNQVAQRAGS
jgi:RNA polymerase sigma-70 factor (ECF subfamily)